MTVPIFLCGKKIYQGNVHEQSERLERKLKKGQYSDVVSKQKENVIYYRIQPLYDTDY